MLRKSAYIGMRFAELCRDGSLEADIKNIANGNYGKLVRFIVDYNLGMSINSSAEIQSLTEQARKNGEWEQIMGFAEEMAAIINVDYENYIARKRLAPKE